MGRHIEDINASKKVYTHMEYRRAKVAQLIDWEHIERFYFKGKEISRQEANNITAMCIKK